MTAIIATAILVKTPIYLYIFIAETVQIFLNNVTIQSIVREKEAFVDINMCVPFAIIIKREETKFLEIYVSNIIYRYSE